MPSGSPFELDIDIGETVQAVCVSKIMHKSSNLLLIFKGKVLKDDQILNDVGIVDTCTVHCVLKKEPLTANISEQQKPTTQKPPAVTPTPALAMMGQPGPDFVSPGLQIPPNMTDAANIFRAISENPNLSVVFSMHYSKRMFSDPQVIESFLSIDPRLKAMMDANPDMAAMMRNPDFVKQLIEICRNPQALQEAMMSQDRQLTQLQNTPGGLNQYLRLFGEMNRPLQEPLPGLPSQSDTSVQSQTIAQSDSSNANVSGEAMPNPWAIASSQAPPVTSTSEASKKSSEPVEPSALFRDTMAAIKLTNIPETTSTTPFIERIRQIIPTLSPRAQYALTQFACGFSTLKEESSELVVTMLNYQISAIQTSLAIVRGEEGTPQVDPNDGPIPPESGNENTYESQLAEIHGMGFCNKEENLQALRYSYGDVTAALDWILRRRGFK
ncbi:hypothetical protein MXB_5533 [Myxobolus squamalis]|nr:hypothetical protein MXB_5533 [Myxobolus squamalis]